MTSLSESFDRRNFDLTVTLARDQTSLPLTKEAYN